MTTEASPTPPAEATHAPTDPRRKEAILETLRDIVGRLLQTAPETLDIYASFLEMGADSIVLAEAIRVVEDSFHMKISIRQLFEQFTTLDTLAEHIEKNSQTARTAAPPPIPAAEAGVSPHADSLERIMSRQLDLLAQFSGVMSQQLAVLGHGVPPSRAVQ